MRYRRITEAGASYFFTLVLHDREPLFADDALVARWREAVAKVRESRSCEIEAEVVLLDHLHLLWTMPRDDADYATRVRLAKTYFTKSFALGSQDSSASGSRRRKGERSIWQRRYWEHTVRDERDFRVRFDYIHYNPVKHGLVSRPAEWPHSTFHEWVERGVYDPWWGSGDKPPLQAWAQWE